MSEALDNALGRGRFGDNDATNTYIETRDLTGSKVDFSLFSEIKEFTTGSQTDNWLICDGHKMTDEEVSKFSTLAKALEYENNPKNKDPFNDGSMIACYNLDGNATDLLGNYDAEWDGDEVYEECKFTTGATGGGYIKFSDDFDNAIDGDLVSLSFWFRKNREDHDNHLLDISVKDDINIYIAYEENNKLVGGNSDGTVTIAENLENGTIYHIVCTKDGTDYKFYLDGEFITDFSQDNCTRTRVSTLLDIDGGGETTDGAIDQFQVFNKILTDDEVKHLNSQKEYYTLPLKPNTEETSYYIKADEILEALPLQDEAFIGTIKTFHRDEIVPDNYSKCDGASVDNKSEYGIYLERKGLKLGFIDSIDPFEDGNLKAKYLVNGDATDLCGNYDGTEQDVEYVDSPLVKTVKQTSNSGRINLGASIAKDVCDGGECSFSFRIKTDKKQSDRYFSLGEDTDIEFAFDTYDTGSRLLFRNGTNYDLKGNTDITDNTWHHIVGVWDGAKIYLYIDGELDSDLDAGESIDFTDKHSYILGYDDADKSTVRIDQIEVYDRALNADNINALWESSISLPNIPSTPNTKYYIKVKSLSTSELKNTEAPHYRVDKEVLTERRWVDGRPIYRNVLDIGTIDDDATFTVFNDADNIDMYRVDDFVINLNDGKAIITSSSSYSNADDDEIKVRFIGKDLNIHICDGDSVTGYIIYEYTKIGDTSESPVANNYVQIDYKDAIMGDLSRYDNSIANLSSIVLANTADINGILIEDLND